MSQATDLLPPYPVSSQPLSVGQVLDRIFKLFRGNFRLFLKIAAVPTGANMGLLVLIGAVLFLSGMLSNPPHSPDPKSMVWVVVSAFVGGLVLMLVYSIFEAASSYASLQANLGVTVSFRQAYEIAWNRGGRFVWLMILRSLWVGLPMLICYAIIAGVGVLVFTAGGKSHPGGDSNPAVFFLIFPLFFLMYFGSMVYAVIMGIRLALAPPACIAENLAASSALKRSLQLSRNAKGRIFVVLLVVYAASYLAFMIFEVLCFVLMTAGVLVATALHIQFVPPWSFIGIALLGIFGACILFLWMAGISASYSIAFAVLYHDQRLRTEGAATALTAGEPT